MLYFLKPSILGWFEYLHRAELDWLLLETRCFGDPVLIW